MRKVTRLSVTDSHCPTDLPVLIYRDAGIQVLPFNHMFVTDLLMRRFICMISLSCFVAKAFMSVTLCNVPILIALLPVDIFLTRGSSPFRDSLLVRRSVWLPWGLDFIWAFSI